MFEEPPACEVCGMPGMTRLSMVSPYYSDRLTSQLKMDGQWNLCFRCARGLLETVEQRVRELQTQAPTLPHARKCYACGNEVSSRLASGPAYCSNACRQRAYRARRRAASRSA